MASRSHVDNTVSERRLRPIYDYLDNANNKKALQEAEKLIKKQKDSKDVLCAKALKALALIRLGRQDEAQAVIKEVHVEGPTDDATLQAMTICYRELHKPELIADAYGIATKKDPQNEELLSHLFMSYVRNAEYKKQQQTAMALYKLKPKNPYYFWAVMSIVMQATSSDEKLAKTMFLPLAERMAVKFVNEDKIEAEAEVQLYLMILEMQEKYEDALKVLEGPLRENLSGYLDVLPKKRAELLSKMEKWPDANAAYKKLILSNPDQWSYYIEYFNSLTHLIDSGWKPADSNDILDVDHTFDQAIDLLSALVEEQEHAQENRTLRGPYLAQIELCKRLSDRNDPLASKLGSLVDIITSYYKKFGTKPSCFLDLAHVLDTLSLPDDQKNALLEKIKHILESGGLIGNLPKDVKQLYQHLCYTQLCHYLGQHDSWSQEELEAHAAALMERYQHGVQLGFSQLPTEFQPYDNYCLLAAHSFIDVWRKTGDESLISKAMVLLEHGSQKSRSNFQIKLLLLKLYNVIGAVGVSYGLYESVDIKHIQQETLGYLITEPLLSAAFFTTASTVLSNSIRFFLGNYKDTVDYLISCYKYGSFTKIPEIVNFRERLNRSLHYSLITAEKMILDLLMEIKSLQDMERVIGTMEIDPENDKNLENLTDNRDVSIFRVWNAKDRVSVEEQMQKSYHEKVTWLRIRNYMLRSIASVFYLTKSPNSNSSHHNEISNGEKRGTAEVLSDLLASLRDTVEAVDKSSLIQSIFPVQAPGATRLLRYLQGNYIDIFISLAELVLNLHRLVESSADAEEKSCLKIISDSKKSFRALHKRLEQLLADNQLFTKPTQIKAIIEDFTNSIETFSIGTVLYSLSHVLLKPARSSLTRKGKKKKESACTVAVEVIQQTDDLQSAMETTGTGLMDLLNQLEEALITSQLAAMSLSEDKKLCIEDEEQSVQDITKNIENSYKNTLKELRNVLLMKMNYLLSLK